MANDITGRIKIDAKGAAAELAAIDKASKETGQSVEGIGTKGQVMARILGQSAAAVQADLAESKRMAELLGNALGPELTARLNADGQLINIVDDLRKVGLTADDVKADIEGLAGSIKQLDDAAMSVKSFESEMGRVRAAQDRVTEGGNMNRSVIANFAGNAAQELPGVTNAFGPLNMAISQAVEYGAEGNIAFKQMLAAGLAMGGVAVVIQGVTTVLQSMADTKAFNADQVHEYKEAIKSVQDPLQTVLDDLREAAAIEFRQDKWNGAFSGLLQETEDITDELFDLGLTAEDFAQGVVGGADGMAAFIEKVRGRFADTADGATIDVERSMQAQKRIIEAVEQASRNYGRALTEAEIEQAVFAATTREVTQSLIDQDPRVEAVVRAKQDDADATKRAREEALEAVEAAKRLTDEYNDQRDAIDDLIGQKTELVGGDIAVREAQRNAAEAAAELNTTIAEQGDDLAAVGVALDSATSKQIAAAQAAADYRAKQLEANGSIVDSKVENQLLREELQRIADNVGGPLAAAIQKYIDLLAAIPSEVNTRFTVNGTPADLPRTPGGVRNYAGGTMYHPGGAASFNEPGNPEMAIFPDGQVFMPDMPTGSKVLRVGRNLAPQSAAMFGGGGALTVIDRGTVHHHYHEYLVVGANGATAGAAQRRVRGMM